MSEEDNSIKIEKKQNKTQYLYSTVRKKNSEVQMNESYTPKATNIIERKKT